MASKEYTWEEIARHNKEDDVWVVIDSKVYDLTKFANLHPGGANVLYAENVAGKDATNTFFGLHRHEVLLRPQYKRLQIGTVQGQKELIKAPQPGELSRVPYGEPTWLSKGYFSPYYTENHRKFQTAVREFFQTIVAPESAKCEDNGKKISQEVVDKMAETNIIAMRLGPGKHLKGRTLMGGIVKPEEFDYFHEAIIHAELSRVSSRAVVDGLLAGLVIAVPPLLNYGTPELQNELLPEFLSGKKYIALAISEAFAGSDVGGLQTTAVRDGDYWVVTGTKKWITNGTFADYFTTGCKTDTGFTVILIPRGPGVSTKQIKTSYSSVAGTAFVTFDKVRVPVSNTLGPIGAGMSVILSNFNHERWMVCATSISAQRLVVEECLKWSTQRIVFGKPLTSQAVIRAKLAAMISRVEACQNWFENITHQMNKMSYKEQSDKLAGPIGLHKQFVSRSGRETAEDATQIFGGRALTVTGMGKFIENYHRTSGFDAILAGAEDVLGDLGVRQALKKMPKDARL
ncbi:peroxisomal acyl-CoA-dehydrogenase [Pholiota molesta]|nr:peroxisomal acyl-CoA-dehydrogenase [Pholiota molesta]